MGYNRTARQRVIDIALQQAGEYAHYLWGSRGGRPEENNEVTFNPKNLTAASVSFGAALCKRGGNTVCGGLYARKTLSPGMTNPTFASSQTLKDWIDENGSLDQTDWDNSLTPRLMLEGTTRQIVWGEACGATRHFDCISFINWCLGKGNSGIYTYDIPQYFYSIEPRQNALSAIDVTNENESDAMPADILIYGKIIAPDAFFQGKIDADRKAGKSEEDDQADLDIIQGTSSATWKKRWEVPCVPQYGIGSNLHHIGFATGRGKGRVHAMDTAHGVMVDTWGDPVRRIRLPDSCF